MYGLGQEEDQELQDQIDRANRIAAAIQSTQVQRKELTDNIGPIFTKFGVGIVAFGVAIYWLLIKR